MLDGRQVQGLGLIWPRVLPCVVVWCGMVCCADGQIDRFGHFKLWHLGGSLCTALSFSSVFGGCLVCSLTNSSSSGLQAVSYSAFAAIFNVGWAATQVSHMCVAAPRHFSTLALASACFLPGPRSWSSYAC